MQQPESGMEERLIDEIADLWSGRAGSGVVLAAGDDCAIVSPPGSGQQILLTTDQIIEGRHFERDRHGPRDLGRKALARSLSDIAAMGGLPLHVLQTVCLPCWATADWHREFQSGMRELADELSLAGVRVVGGDVAGGDRFVATVTVVGCVEQGTATLRSGARPGDGVFVSGALGGSAWGLKLVLEGGGADTDHPAVRRHCAPVPQLALGLALREIPASAAIDISDGLAIDANRLAAASGIAIAIDAESVPLFPGCGLEQALQSGEEYELLFTVPDGGVTPEGFDVTPIGRVEEGSGVLLETAGHREPLGPAGFSHF